MRNHSRVVQVNSQDVNLYCSCFYLTLFCLSDRHCPDKLTLGLIKVGKNNLYIEHFRAYPGLPHTSKMERFPTIIQSASTVSNTSCLGLSLSRAFLRSLQLSR